MDYSNPFLFFFPPSGRLLFLHLTLKAHYHVSVLFLDIKHNRKSTVDNYKGIFCKSITEWQMFSRCNYINLLFFMQLVHISVVYSLFPHFVFITFLTWFDDWENLLAVFFFFFFTKLQPTIIYFHFSSNESCYILLWNVLCPTLVLTHAAWVQWLSTKAATISAHEILVWYFIDDVNYYNVMVFHVSWVYTFCIKIIGQSKR